MVKAKTYCGDPGECNYCHQRLDIGDRFYDVRTLNGTWGNFCPACVQHVATLNADGKVVIGTGYGQRYDKRESDGSAVWIKTAG